MVGGRWWVVGWGGVKMGPPFGIKRDCLWVPIKTLWILKKWGENREKCGNDKNEGFCIICLTFRIRYSTLLKVAVV